MTKNSQHRVRCIVFAKLTIYCGTRVPGLFPEAGNPSENKNTQKSLTQCSLIKVRSSFLHVSNSFDMLLLHLQSKDETILNTYEKTRTTNVWSYKMVAITIIIIS